MTKFDWMSGMPGAVTVCDLQGIILEMNEKSVENFAKYGGRDLIGKNLLDCHPEPARSKLESMLQTGESNVYTIERNGVKMLVYQASWHSDNQRRGLVELLLEIPFDLPHFVR
jgi:hypothetical protein